MNKKSQGLSLTVIIVAVIALIVLVVLIAIFTGRLGIFSRGVEETESNICISPQKPSARCYATNPDTEKYKDLGAKDCEKGKKCFVRMCKSLGDYKCRSDCEEDKRVSLKGRYDCTSNQYCCKT